MKFWHSLIYFPNSIKWKSQIATSLSCLKIFPANQQFNMQGQSKNQTVLTCKTNFWSITFFPMFGWKSGDSRNRKKNSYTSWNRDRYHVNYAANTRSPRWAGICHRRRFHTHMRTSLCRCKEHFYVASDSIKIWTTERSIHVWSGLLISIDQKSLQKNRKWTRARNAETET